MKCYLYSTRFHYEGIKTRYWEKAHRTDTDSVMYHIETPNIAKDMVEVKEHFDVSNLYYQAGFSGNKAVVGKMTHDVAGCRISDFVGVRHKIYSFDAVRTAPMGQLSDSIRIARRGSSGRRKRNSSTSNLSTTSRIRP